MDAVEGIAARPVMIAPRLCDGLTCDRICPAGPAGLVAAPTTGRAIAPTKMMDRFELHGVG
jgi:hypothetical protein